MSTIYVLQSSRFSEILKSGGYREKDGLLLQDFPKLILKMEVMYRN